MLDRLSAAEFSDILSTADDKALRLQALTIAHQYSNDLPSVLLHAKLMVDFINTGQVLSDNDYTDALLTLNSEIKK